jgi:hypothetical protein
MKAFRVLLLVALTSGLNSCSVDTTVASLPLSITVDPSFVCPAEAVTVAWDAGDQDDSSTCRSPGLVGTTPGGTPFERCVFIELSSSPIPVEFGTSVRFQTRGSRSVPIETTNTFTVRAHSDNYRGHGLAIDRTASATATVVDIGPAVQTFSSAGECAGSTPAWKAVNLRELLSSCVEVQEVCNLSSDTVRLDDAEAPGSRPVTLLPSMCTPVFNGRGTNLSVQNTSFTPRPDVCGSTTTSGPPPSINLSVRIACNRSLEGCAGD